jgi:ubiquitin C-terminal hydrolase
LNFLKLLEISVNNDENKKNEILLEKDKTNNVSLFDIIYKKYLSILNNKPGDSNSNENNELISNSDETTNKETDENDKFILLEDKKTNKKEDNSSTEELHKYYGEIVCNALNYSKDQSNIPKLISLINILKKVTKKDKNGNDSDSDDREYNSINAYSFYQQHSSKKQCDHVGLKNLGCICYMNSTMQQMYMVPTFRRAIMWSDDGKPPNPSSNYRYSCEDDNLLHQLQEMYTYLTYSEKMDYNPKGFCYSCKDLDGNPVNIAAQQDSQEFLNNFCDKIENSLKPTKFKHIVADVFTGKTCSSVLCDKCKHISNRFEDFYTLTLEVKNINTLNDSLHKLIIPEIIDDFKCSNCNQNVRISKITSLNKLPNVLIIHLKRFYLDYETCHTTKINTKMEFPTKINLKEFCIEEITKNYSVSKDEAIDDIYTRQDEYY